MKCKDCTKMGCPYRVYDNQDVECAYLQWTAKEQFNWQSFRAEAAKDILCALISDGSIAVTKKQVTNSIWLADELIKQLKEK